MKTEQGRLSVGCIAMFAAIVLSACAGGSSDTANSGEPPEAAQSVTDTSALEVRTTIPNGPDVPTARPTTSEVDDNATVGTLATVPVDTVEVMDPIQFDEIGKFATGLSVRLVEIEAIEGEARIQGEIAGPALRVHLEVTNDSDVPISLERSQVEITYGADRSPGVLLTGSGSSQFAGSVAPGESSTSTVVYVIPLDQRDIVQVSVTQTTGERIVVFEGSVE